MEEEKRERNMIKVERLGMTQREFTMKGKGVTLHPWGETHVQRRGMEGIQERRSEGTFYVDEGKQVRERASKEMCMD